MRARFAIENLPTLYGANQIALWHQIVVQWAIGGHV